MNLLQDFVRFVSIAWLKILRILLFEFKLLKVVLVLVVVELGRNFPRMANLKRHKSNKYIRCVVMSAPASLTL